jgi:hemolysin III
MDANLDHSLLPRLPEDRPVDEAANLVTHALGFVLSVLASAFLMRIVIGNNETITVVACGVYCGSLMGLYAASTLSHLFHDLAWRRFFRTLDQACIYLLIAGSFTPIAVVYLWQEGWPVLLAAMWLLAIFGVLLVLRMRNLTPAAKFTYGFLGWLPIVSLKTLYESLPFPIFAWLLAGGLFYSVGSIFLRFADHVRYLHALWHAFVIAGSTCHYMAILMAVM